MNSEKYKLSFTAVSLAISESIKIAEAYFQLKDWDAVKKKVWDENLLQARTRSSMQRIYQELWPRLSQLTDEQLELLVEGNHQEQKHILWYAVCMRYAYVRDFAVEVLHEKFLRLDYELTDFDYDVFFNRKADWHPELDRIKETTRKKVKTRVFWMLREAGFLSDDSLIVPTSLSRRVMDVLASDTLSVMQIFPAFLEDNLLEGE